jgi:hypothetical protein
MDTTITRKEEKVLDLRKTTVATLTMGTEHGATPLTLMFAGNIVMLMIVAVLTLSMIPQ